MNGYVDTERLKIRTYARDGSLTSAGFLCPVLKYIQIFGGKNRYLFAGLILRMFYGSKENRAVWFTTSDQVVATAPWRFPPSKIQSEELFSFKATDIRTIEPRPCPSKGGGYARVEGFKADDFIYIWEINAHLHDGQTISLMRTFANEAEAKLSSVQLNMALREVLAAMPD